MLLENVKNLLHHDSGRTFQTILSTLHQLNYLTLHKILDSSPWVPQHRKRLFILCFNREVFGEDVPFTWPDQSGAPKCLDTILEPNPPEKYTLTPRLWSYLLNRAEDNRKAGKGFKFRLFGPNDTASTLSARYYKDGSDILIRQSGKPPRRLTPREAARIMGFDREVADWCGWREEEFPIVVSDTQAYRQFGNAVVPWVVREIGKGIVRVLHWRR